MKRSKNTLKNHSKEQRILDSPTSISTYIIKKISTNIGHDSINFDQYVPYGYVRERGSATRGLLVTDLVILNHGQVTRTIPELAPLSPNYHTNGRTLELWTDLTCIAPLHGGSLVVLDSNSWHASHDPIPGPLGYRSSFLMNTVDLMFVKQIRYYWSISN
ncbi:hypothetical protein TNCV_2147121 [Trichonephila clavipes]|uniref:Uncharacterized protein n=1 Tax=Trichonephila clavipes TaxID=2585209 RepID=A0A8X6VS15_TRICX|nr:hypothetical protein TNCV_2147121 [Trichonephila clavipes]